MNTLLKPCIIGAGVTGIELAKNYPDAFVLEKSRGIGGRLAGRRLGEHRLNHGPKEFYLESTQEHISDPHGWIKLQSRGLNIINEWEVSSFELLSDHIVIHSKLGKQIGCSQLILTAPAPQSFDILTRSGLTADFLKTVSYKPEIQFMILGDQRTNVTELSTHLDLKHTTQFEDHSFLSLYAIKDSYLDQFMEKDKDEIKQFFVAKSSHLLDWHAHKWRYSEVTTPLDSEYQTHFKSKNIFLAGDYFGLHGVKSALDSAEKLRRELLVKK